ncbi:MAG: DEAD/DEAH box helicase [Solirubrobacterales bacterium]|nr:DEAD/DEAH box helicase [Solirubrobacterales bacterium]
MTSFRDLGLKEDICRALDELGYEEPSPIQAKAIPELLAGYDMIGQAQTGTGKTAAFGLPLLQYLDPADDETQAVVLTPTRELCIQVTQALRSYAEHLDVNVVAVFGGTSVRDQAARVRSKAHVVVATVGRMMDLISRGALVLTGTRYVVLDEADEMLDLGFIEDVERILRMCPSGRQTMLFSATMPPPIARLAESYMYDPVTISITPKKLTVDAIEQAYVEVDAKRKTDRLIEVLRAEEPEQAIVFCRTKIGTARLDRALRDRGLQSKALHGDMSQGQRDGVMISFKEHKSPLLVATDVAARGLDIDHVTHVINYDLPNNSEIYVHRIGRTGRVGRTGRAITFVTPKERGEIEQIERDVKTSIGEWEPPEERLDHAPRPKRRHERRRAREEAPTAADAADEPAEGTADRAAEGAPGPGGEPGNGHVKLFINRGSRSGIEEGDIRWALSEGAVIPGEAIHDVRVLERFTFVDLDGDQAEKALDRLDGTKLKGKQIRLEYANG